MRSLKPLFMMRLFGAIWLRFFPPERPRRREIARALATTLGGFFLVLLLILLLVRANFVVALDLKIHDSVVNLNRQIFDNPVAIDPVIVGIDDAFLDSIDEPLTLSHIHLANLLRALSAAGATVIGLDLALPEKRFETIASTQDKDPEGEHDFHRILLQGLLQTIPQTKVVAARVMDQQRHRYREMQLDYAAVLNLQGEQNQAIASVHLCPDSDGKIRRYPGGFCQPEASNRSLSSEVAAAAGKREIWDGLVNYQLGGAFNYISVKDVLRIEKESAGAERLRQMFEGKIVLVGSTQEYVDLLDLPVPLAKWHPDAHFVPGVLVHAQLLRGMLNQGLIQVAPSLVITVLSVVAALFWFVQGIVRKLSCVLILCVVMGLVTIFLMHRHIWLAPSAILLSGMLAAGSRSALQAWQHYMDKQRLSRAFTGRVSPSVMKEIISGEAENGQVSRRLPVCVLFSDVRNFTTLCEHMQAEEVVSLLNRYFAVMVAVIHRQGGTVDKFMGDGLMAFFGAPNSLETPEKNAYDAACEMLKALEKLNAELVQEGRQKWAIGLGLHTGEAIIGYLGSAERNEYTAIGDVVNTAARLEGLSKELGSPIICSEEVARQLGFPDFLHDKGEQKLKGRSAMRVFTTDCQQGF